MGNRSMSGHPPVDPATMADTDRATGEGMPAPDVKPARAERKLIVRTKNPAFDGEIMGLKFTDGQCETDNAALALASQEAGCTVTDKASGQPAW